MSYSTFSTQTNNNSQYVDGIISGTFKSLASVCLSTQVGTGNLQSPLQYIGISAGERQWNTGVSSAVTTSLDIGRTILTIKNGQIDLSVTIANIPAVPGATTCDGYSIDGKYAYIKMGGDVYRIDITTYTPGSGVLMTKSGGTLTATTANIGVAVRDDIMYLARSTGSNLVEKYTVSGTTYTFVGNLSLSAITDLSASGLQDMAIGSDGWVIFVYETTAGGLGYRTALLDGSGTLIKQQALDGGGDIYYCFSIDDVFLSVLDGTIDGINVVYIK